jgi:thiol:disulfide interchange protein DsbD
MRKVLIAIVLLSLSVLGFAAGEVKWQALSTDKPLTVSSSSNLTIEATIAEGWHLYSVVDQDGPFPTTFSGEGIEIGKPIREATLVREMDKGFQKEIEFFKGKATFILPVTVTGDPKAAKLSVRFQVCKDGTCIPPTSVDISLNQLPVVASSATNLPPVKTNGSKGDNSSEASKVQDAKNAGLWAYLNLAFLAGLTALLTPCVFPMIPITVSFFSKRREEGSAVKQAFLYCGGIIGTFTILGILASVIAGATGLSRLANNPWLNLGLAGIFIVLSLSLFGVFEIGLPSKFVNKFDATGKTGWIAPIFMGLTFSLTSFTCTLPFVGAVLVSSAGGDYLYPTLGMLAFSTAFSIPFFLLALFPQAVSKLPKSGSWMVVVKAYMGFIELIAAVKFLSTFDLAFQLGVLTREVNLALWFLLLVLAGIYLLGWIQLPKVEEGKIGMFRRVFAIFTLVLAGWVANGLNGSSLGKLVGFLPPTPYPYKSGAKPVGKLEWERGFAEDLTSAIAEAQKSGKPIFIDFTGQYCTNCRVMEANVFPNPEVTKAFGNFVGVTLYTDRNTEADNKNAKYQMELTKTSTLPTYAIVQPDGKTLVSSVPFTENPQKFAEWLNAHSGTQ